MARKNIVKVLVGLIVVFCLLGGALAQMPNPYGPAISLEDAKKAAAPALAEAAKNKWTMAVPIVGPAGNFIYYEKMAKNQLARPEMAFFKRGRGPHSQRRAQ